MTVCHCATISLCTEKNQLQLEFDCLKRSYSKSVVLGVAELICFVLGTEKEGKILITISQDYIF